MGSVTFTNNNKLYFYTTGKGSVGFVPGSKPSKPHNLINNFWLLHDEKKVHFDAYTNSKRITFVSRKYSSNYEKVLKELKEYYSNFLKTILKQGKRGKKGNPYFQLSFYVNTHYELTELLNDKYKLDFNDLQIEQLFSVVHDEKIKIDLNEDNDIFLFKSKEHFFVTINSINKNQMERYLFLRNIQYETKNKHGNIIIPNIKNKEDVVHLIKFHNKDYDISEVEGLFKRIEYWKNKA